MTKIIEIAGRKVGPGEPCFIVAEACGNHTGNMRLAKEMIDAAYDAKVDAVKFQAWKAERMASRFTPMAEYQKKQGNNFQDLLRPLELSLEQNRMLKEYAEKKHLIWFSTPFDDASFELLAQLDPPCYKVGSGEMGNLTFLRSIAAKGKPVILSTGMSYWSEVDESIRALEEHIQDIILLHCNSTYPCAYSEANLRGILSLGAAFEYPVGYSDHTLGIHVSLAAVALGACVIERHFTLDKNLPGWDQRASIDVNELKDMVKQIREIEIALGSGRKRPTPNELEIRHTAFKSVVAEIDIPAGKNITRKMITIKRPGFGIPAKDIDRVVGRRAKNNIVADQIITWQDLD